MFTERQKGILEEWRKVHEDRYPITAQCVKAMPYTEFVSFVNQWNVPPGAYDSISKLARFSDLGPNSSVLEIACTTGFTSRELHTLTGCRAHGVDICKPSVDTAKLNKALYLPEAPISFEARDAYEFWSTAPFTHIAVGAATRFFPRPEELMSKLTSWFGDLGYLLATPFYIIGEIPREAVELAKRTFQITPTTEPYKEVMRIYSDFEVLYEDRNQIAQETESEITHYCQSIIDRAGAIWAIDSGETLDAAYERLASIKRAANALRPYQRYSVLVLRYRREHFPNRYVELF